MAKKNIPLKRNDNVLVKILEWRKDEHKIADITIYRRQKDSRVLKSHANQCLSRETTGFVTALLKDTCLYNHLKLYHSLKSLSCYLLLTLQIHGQIYGDLTVGLVYQELNTTCFQHVPLCTALGKTF